MSVIFTPYARFVASRAKSLDSIAADLHHATTGMATEAGEALDTTKKIWVYGQNLLTRNKEGQTHEQNLKEEMGDMLYYIQHCANLLGTTLEELMVANQEKLTARYPTGYSDKAALERADKA